MREVQSSIPSQGPRHTKDAIKMVPVVWHSTLKREILALSEELREEKNVMDKIWDRKSFKVEGHWPLWRGRKKRMTTQKRQKCITKTNNHDKVKKICIMKKRSPFLVYFIVLTFKNVPDKPMC